MLCGAVVLHVAGAGWEPVWLSALYLVVAAGYGLLNGPVMSAATAELRPELSGVGVGVYNLLFFLGGAVSVALAGAILRVRADAGEAINPLFSGTATEFSDAFIVVVAAAELSFALAIMLRPRPLAAMPGDALGDLETLAGGTPGWRLQPRAKPNIGR
jgi:hypothetical protein